MKNVGVDQVSGYQSAVKKHGQGDKEGHKVASGQIAVGKRVGQHDRDQQPQRRTDQRDYDGDPVCPQHGILFVDNILIGVRGPLGGKERETLGDGYVVVRKRSDNQQNKRHDGRKRKKNEHRMGGSCHGMVMIHACYLLSKQR